MEVTAMNSGSVHVLRHSFQPSEHLSAALENYLEPGVSYSRFLLYATRLITLNDAIHPAHEISMSHDKINADFINRHRDRIEFGRSEPAYRGETPQKHIIARRLGDGALRVGFMPKNEEVFNDLMSGFDRMPNDITIPKGRAVRYYLHADLPERLLLPDEAIEANTQVVAAELDVVERARMFYANPNAIERRVLPLIQGLPGATRTE